MSISSLYQNSTVNYPLLLPSAQGINGQTLINNGSGALIWENPTFGISSSLYMNGGTSTQVASGTQVNFQYLGTIGTGASYQNNNSSWTLSSENSVITNTSANTIYLSLSYYFEYQNTGSAEGPVATYIVDNSSNAYCIDIRNVVSAFNTGCGSTNIKLVPLASFSVAFSNNTTDSLNITQSKLSITQIG